MFLALLGLALATEGLLVAQNGAPVADVPTELSLVLHDGGQAVTPEELDVRSRDGEVLATRPSGVPGVWDVRVRSAPDAERMRFVVRADAETIELEVPVADRPDSGLSGPGRLEALAGEEIRIRLNGDDLPEPDQLVASAPEGELVGIERVKDHLEVRWRPALATDPRVVPIGVRDMRQAGAPPEWTVVRLGARLPVTVETEPGATLSLRMNGRSYGPAVAGEDGKATVVVDVRPGETTADATLTDTLGNVQNSKVTLARAPEPSLAALPEGSIVPGAPLPPLHLAGVSPTGGPWKGAAPTCQASGGRELAVVEIKPGRWLATLPPIDEDILLDLRVDCRMGPATVSSRVAVQEGVPARIVLRAWPQELSSDFPVAQVQAWLEDASGDRLPPEGLALLARHGELTGLEREDLGVRADYKGVLEEPEDAVVAAWNHATGSGHAATLLVGHTRDDSGLLVTARALDPLGRPLAGVMVTLVVEDATTQVATDSRGFVQASFLAPTTPAIAEARTDELSRQSVVLPWALGPELRPDDPDLHAVAPISIRTGRVRRISLSTDRPVLLTGTGDTARLTIVLEDASGRPVTDEAIRVTASEGVVTEPRPQADGSLHSVYAPPPGLSAGEVELSVTSPDGTFDATVTLRLEPEPVARAPSLHVGGIANLGAIRAPVLGGDLEQRLPIRVPLSARLAVDWYRDRETITSDAGDMEIQMDVLPIALTAHRRWSRGLWSTWVGAGVVVAPYRVERFFGGKQGGGNIGVHRPGAELYAGTGYRVRFGELYGEARYLAMQSSAAEYDGPIGGLVAIVGIRVVY
ncbi:MAG: hypothetical protein GY913_19740 [Proteobacteria bacterium]|nr:hypothetical protein [Pseudomonadota bacterium]MCP4919141.1 hypothetical protein [Pseudomonadota bacterium]